MPSARFSALYCRRCHRSRRREIHTSFVVRFRLLNRRVVKGVGRVFPNSFPVVTLLLNGIEGLRDMVHAPYRLRVSRLLHWIFPA